MKLITRNNFEEVYPEFVAALQGASYIAVDMEFTGIDRRATTNFLRPPEEAFEDKIAAARHFSVVQIGFSIFRGTELLSPQSGRDSRGATGDPSASSAYKETMLKELRLFRPQDSDVQGLVEVLESMANKGRVDPRDISKMEDLRKKIRQRCSQTSAGTIYDELSAYDALDEVDKAIDLATRWEKRLTSPRRQLWARSYSFYLLPAAWLDDQDPELVLSTKTMEFLRSNNMDLNMWISEGLSVVPFEPYARARRADRIAAELSDPKKEMDAKLVALRQWMQGVTDCDTRDHLLGEFNEIENFARNGELHESLEVCLPHLSQSHLSKFNALMRDLGLRVSKRIMKKLPPEATTHETIFRNPRYFGTRLLSALVTATRQRRKPLVIHNGLSDLAFLCCLMHKEPPQNIVEFKRLVREVFPVFYDTRTLTCAPSLQSIIGLTGPLMKTYLILSEQNKTVDIYHDAANNFSTDGGPKEHDAAWDAFMTGSLFAFAQQELAQVNADYRRLCGITPVHGCIFSVHFLDDNEDCLVQPRSAAAYLLHRSDNRGFHTDSLRDKFGTLVKCVTFMYNGDDCLVTISDAAVSKRMLSQIEQILHSWAQAQGYSVTALDVEGQMNRHRIKHLTEK